MKIARHSLGDEHLKVCADCRRRLEFMQRVGDEAYLIAGELEMSANEAVRTLITLAHNLSQQNDCLDDFIDHFLMSMDIIREERRPN
jgi:hypothetical protein